MENGKQKVEMKTDSQHNTKAIGSADSEIKADESSYAKKLWRTERAGEKRLFTATEVVIILIICLGVFAAVWQVIAWTHS